MFGVGHVGQAELAGDFHAAVAGDDVVRAVRAGGEQDGFEDAAVADVAFEGGVLFGGDAEAAGGGGVDAGDGRAVHEGTWEWRAGVMGVLYAQHGLRGQI